MTPSRTNGQKAYPRPLPVDVELPDADVRTKFNERAFRNWTESSRRIARVAVLAASDAAAGLAGVAIVQRTWEIVSGGGLRPVPDHVPLLAMVFCLQPLALRITGAYSGGRARADLLKIAGGIAIAAFLGWVQARLFGREVPELPNKAAYLYSAIVITAIAWSFRSVIDRVLALGYRAGMLQRKLLVVGTSAEAESLGRVSRLATGCDFQVIGWLSAGDGGPVVAETSRHLLGEVHGVAERPAVAAGEHAAPRAQHAGQMGCDTSDGAVRTLQIAQPRRQRDRVVERGFDRGLSLVGH